MAQIFGYLLGLPQHTETHHLNDDMEIKPVNPIDSLETRSQSSLSEDLPVDASSTPTPPVRNSTLNIPDGGALSSLGGNSAKKIAYIYFFCFVLCCAVLSVSISISFSSCF